jgi:hypothetical protein
LGDETAPLPSTQVLTQIAEGHEIEAFAKIEEVELQHATNVTSTSAGAVGSSQNSGGGLHQSRQWAPSPAQVMQEHTESGQHQIEDWQLEDSYDEAAAEEELARAQQEIERLCKK